MAATVAFRGARSGIGFCRHPPSSPRAAIAVQIRPWGRVLGRRSPPCFPCIGIWSRRRTMIP
eukprot:392835-Lingulodinium_polyedra.AAC.1